MSLEFAETAGKVIVGATISAILGAWGMMMAMSRKFVLRAEIEDKLANLNSVKFALLERQTGEHAVLLQEGKLEMKAQGMAVSEIKMHLRESDLKLGVLVEKLDDVADLLRSRPCQMGDCSLPRKKD